MKLKVLVLRRHLYNNVVETVKEYLDTIDTIPTDSFYYTDGIRIIMEKQLDPDIIPLLEEKGGDVDFAKFLLAINQNHFENIQKNNKNIKDCNTFDTKGQNIFDKGLLRIIRSTASLNDKLHMIQILLDAGGDIDRSHILHWSIDNHEESTEFIRFILEKNPNLNTLLSGQTPLEIAQDFNEHAKYRNEITAQNLRLIQQATTKQNSQLSFV